MRNPQKDMAISKGRQLKLKAATDLLESLQDFVTLAEMSKQQLQSTRHQLWVIVHDEIQQHSQKLATTLTIQVQFVRLITGNR